MIIAIGFLKGGVGKTTLCTSLATTFVERGSTVAIVDLDPQAHAKAWAEDVKLQCSAFAVPSTKLADAIERLRDRFDVILIDTPPDRIGAEGGRAPAAEAMLLADVLLMPFKPARKSTQSYRATVQAFRSARESNPELKAFLVASKIKQTSIVRAVWDAVCGALPEGVEALETQLMEANIFELADAEQKTILAYENRKDGRKAAASCRSLADEIERIRAA